MTGPAIVVTDHAFGGTVHEEALARATGRELRVLQCVEEEETVRAVGGADLVFVNFAPVSRAVLEALAPGATVIRYGIGYDNVDIEAARSLGVRVANVPDYGVDTVADHTVACLLALLRRTGPFTAAVRERGWLTASALGPIRGFAETTVGLIGTGRIGRAVAARLRPFHFEVIAYDPFVSPSQLADEGVEQVELSQLLARAHAVSLHAPLTAQNRHLIGESTLEALRSDAVLVNTSRGGLVDEEALARALGSGRLAGAALDVFDPEPLREDSPLRGLENVILTPHAAFYSVSSLDALQRLAAEEGARALAGQPLRCPVA
ncbi:D-3-phosphoglycerate dehydrogenase [Rathayibacter oskolensis]|uniref:D-3-phosphoglycerate dehydrogenase n=1 Tax=Rathayibacter oskolensis TaxID=1891671 RepID=A0A1X7PCD6_9MICO|nr:C-terminal binding protein [Rathayibacter oskolensis]SMH48856.1 D-3-phosphoglycerate dehydrogenase [Rathayibacter oskolensis]